MLLRDPFISDMELVDFSANHQKKIYNMTTNSTEFVYALKFVYTLYLGYYQHLNLTSELGPAQTRLIWTELETSWLVNSPDH